MLGLTDDTGPLPYFPAKLGTPVQHPSEGDRKDGRIGSQHYEAWRESFAIEPTSWTERSEAEAFTERKRGGGYFHVIVGEPGAGKTRLLEEWFRRWWTGEAGSLSFGMRVPVLVRLRQLESADARLNPDQLADQLWDLAQADARLLTPNVAHLYRPERARLFRPVWLLDGLDELSSGAPLEDWLRAIAILPGDVVATCRTVVWQAERAISGGVRPRRVETILPLRTDADRARFLHPALRDGADHLTALLGRHAALSPLAGNPLLLGLAELLWRETPDFLPASRAEFYRRAVAVLWRRRVSSHLRNRTGDRDRVLERLAEQMDGFFCFTI
ncbi:NACHT domain-containing protein [Azospirillum argentinense]|uniref:NACHT domain-containing protein n=1 Tax=Azospirillum brasilense TaxID=192 RepID=A0A4D8PZU6_AZOBR|nr:NACHT domain-containing protein [Azospirillum argentinense]QCO03335.1 NACHT domain-containing protein [Azospirillum argentinense]